MAMLHLILPPEEDRERIVVGYVHHGTGDHADQAEKHVRSAAFSLGLKFLANRVNIDEESVKISGFEAVARRLRYQSLNKMCESTDCSLILTAHTLDDRSENVLLFLFRGAGMAGLSGPRERHGNIWRPVIHYTHNDLIEFLESIAVPYIEDPSNQDLRFTRNLIRHKLKPEIVQKFGKGAWKNLANSAERLESSQAILREIEVEALEKALIRRKHRWLLLDTEALLLYLQELRVRTLILCWELVKNKESDSGYLPRSTIRRLLGIVHGNPGESTELPGGVSVRLTTSGLVFNGITQEDAVVWDMPGSVVLADGTKLVAEKSHRGEFSGISPYPGSVEYVDAGVTGDSFHVRPWREGDRFEPLGQPGKFRKVARVIKGTDSRSINVLWIAESNQTIQYIPGHRIAHGCRVRKNSNSIWRLTYTTPDNISSEHKE